MYTAELISSVPSHNPTFLARNFTDAEISYCRSQPSPPSSFAARWVGKEAVFKSLGVKSKGAAAAMKDIEILNDASGVPTIRLHGEAKAKASERGISKVLISLSHSEVSNLSAYFVQQLIPFRRWPLHSLKRHRTRRSLTRFSVRFDTSHISIAFTYSTSYILLPVIFHNRFLVFS